MASRRTLLSILRSSSRRSASTCPISNTNPLLSPPSLPSTPASAYGYLTTSVKKIGERAIVDEFPGKASTAQVFRLTGSLLDVILEEGIPEIGSDLEFEDYYLGERTCSVEGGERMLKSDFPASESILKAAQYLDETVWDPNNDFPEISRDELIKLKLAIMDNNAKPIRGKKFLEWNDYQYQVEKWHRRKCLRKMRKKLLPPTSWILRNGSIGTVCRLGGDKVVDVRFDKKIEFGSYLEVLPSTTLAPLMLEVCYLLGDGNVVRAVATNGTEGLAVGDRLFGFPTSNLEQMDSLKSEVASLQKKLRLMKQKEKPGRNKGGDL